jgi:hypothetical protein
MNQINEQYWNIKLDKVKNNLIKNRFNVEICNTESDVINTLLNNINSDNSIGFGGSTTLEELKIPELLKEKKFNIINYPDYSLPRETIIEQRRQSLLADVFLMSSNAITESGYLINIDGMSNRVAGLMFGPKKVIIIAGINKIVKDTKSGIERIKNYVAPKNCLRLNRKTPCIKTSECMDCSSPDRICCNTVITKYQTDPKRIHIILVKMNLGY